MVDITSIAQGSMQRDKKCPVCLCFTKELHDSIIANGEKSVVLPIFGSDGTTLVGLNIDGAEHLMAEPVTYEWAETNPVDGDGVVEWTATASDGSDPQVITLAEPTVDSDTIFVSQSIVDGVLIQEFADVDGTPLPNIETDMSSLLSKGIIAGDGIVITTDATTGERTISSSVVDTDTFATVSGSTVTDAAGNSVTVPAGSTYNATTNQITTSDGQVVDLMVDTDTDTFATQNAAGDLVLADGTVVPLTDENTTYTLSQNANGDTVLTDSGGVAQTISNTDTDVSAVKLEWDSASSSLVSTVTEDSIDVVGILAVPTDTRKCGDLTLVIDPDTGAITKKLLLPAIKHHLTKTKRTFFAKTGAAVDLLVGEDFWQIDNTNPAFTAAENSACYPTNHMQTDIRLGAWEVRIATTDDSWHWNPVSNGDTHDILLLPPIIFNGYGSKPGARGSTSNALTGSDHVDLTAAQSALDRTTDYSMHWDAAASRYTPAATNAILTNTSTIIKYRSQIEA